MAEVRRKVIFRWKLFGAAAAAGAVGYVGLPTTAGEGGRTFMGLAPSMAAGEYGDAPDVDQDGLPDEFERFAESDPYLADSDADGFQDGAEWVLKSNPSDSSSIPDVAPAIRSWCYEAEGQLRFFTALYPAEHDLVDAFAFYAASKSFEGAMLGDPGTGLGIVDATELLPTLVDSITTAPLYGLTILGFQFDLDLSLLDSAGPLNFGWAATLAGVSVSDQLMLSTEGATSFLLAGCPGLAGAGPGFAIHPLDPVPPPYDELPEYCAVTFSSGTPAGLATMEYSVESAACAPGTLLYCINADCSSLAGQKFLMVDYGFLHGE